MSGYSLPSQAAIAAALAELASLIKTVLDAEIAKLPSGVQPPVQVVATAVETAIGQLSAQSAEVIAVLANLKALGFTGHSQITGAPGADLA